MSDELVQSCFSEVQACMKMHPGLQVLLVQCDARGHTSELLSSADEFTVRTVHGRGGTDFRPAFAHIQERADAEGWSLGGVVYMTDLDGTFPRKSPDVPVLWLTPAERGTAPFGRIVRIMAP